MEDTIINAEVFMEPEKQKEDDDEEEEDDHDDAERQRWLFKVKQRNQSRRVTGGGPQKRALGEINEENISGS